MTHEQRLAQAAELILQASLILRPTLQEEDRALVTLYRRCCSLSGDLSKQAKKHQKKGS